MARDAKIIQRGINNTANDLAVPNATMTDSVNVIYDRDGVAATRYGTGEYWNGAPDYSYDLDSANALSLGNVRGFYNLFSGQYAFHLNQGLLLVRDEVTASDDQWMSIPVNMTHRWRYHGQVSSGGSTYEINQLGRALIFCKDSGPFNWQAQSTHKMFVGAIGNDASAATDATSVQDLKFKTAFDTVSDNSGRIYVSDDTSIRSAASITAAFSLLAGSITASGSTDGTGTAARFSNAEWMATDGTNVYVSDNTNQIRKVTSSGVVTTLAGSTTAGDVDGVGTAARFRTISGLTYSGGFLYVAESGGSRIRKVDVSTASVTIYAGALTPTPGFTDGTGTAARFNTPNGIEAVGLFLFVGDTANNALRRIVISTADVSTTLLSTSPSTSTGMIGGAANQAGFSIPSVTLRSSRLSSNTANLPSITWLSLECQAPNSSTDVGFYNVFSAGGTPSGTGSAGQAIYHTARCPNSLPTATTGPMKLDTWGPNAYRDQDVRAADVQGGAVFVTMEYPRILDAYTRINATNAAPRLRQLGIQWPEAPSCTTTSGSTFAANSAWAYRTVCGLYLPNGRIALGPPSERVVVTTGGSVAGSVTAYPSPMLPYDGMPFVQFYRTRTTASSLTDPGDTMFLCNEQPLTYGQGVTITDLCPDDLLGAELYTNQYAFGAASASLPPPAFANEVAEFNNQAVLANFNTQATCRVKVLGVSSLVSGTSTITLTTTGPGNADACETLTVFFNSSATDPSIKRAQIASGGSAAQNAVQTAKNIVRVINRCPDAFMFRALYDESDPGSFVVYSVLPGRSRDRVATDEDGANTLTQVDLTFATNASTSFATIALTPSQRQVAALAPSDVSDADSFPVVNQVKCGASAESILRCLPIAETLLVVKDSHVYRTEASFSFQIYETALSCKHPDSFARLNNQWIGLFTAGFRSLTGSQAVNIGRAIDRRILATYNGQTFASGAASDRQGTYLCKFDNSIYCYSSYGDGAWGTVELNTPAQPKWVGSFRDAFLYSFSDYANGQMVQLTPLNTSTTGANGLVALYKDWTMTSSATPGATLNKVVLLVTPSLVPLATNPDAGALVGGYVSFSGSSSRFGEIASATINSSTQITLTLVASVTTWTSDTVTVYMPIPIMAQYAPSFAPGENSQFGDVLVTLERVRSGSLTCTFYNRKDVANVTQPYGQYDSTNGETRINAMSVIEDPAVGANAQSVIDYYDIQRFATPAERSQDQSLVVALSSQQALAPLALKAVVVNFNEGGKVKQ